MTTKYSISAASRITGKSRTTISKHLKQGKLSCEEGTDGAKLIDASELIRAYGDACDFGREEGREASSHKAHRDAPPTGQGGQAELHTLQTRLDKEVEERQREREQFRQQIEHLQGSLNCLLKHEQAGSLGKRKMRASHMPHMETRCRDIS